MPFSLKPKRVWFPAVVQSETTNLMSTDPYCKISFVPEYHEENIYSYNVVLPKKEVIKTKNNDEKKFKIQKTDMIDVYELYELETNKFDSIACVNKLKTSMFLKEQFKNKDSFITNTKYSVYFSSWIPVF